MSLELAPQSVLEVAIPIISRVFQCDEKDISSLAGLKKGMTNHSFSFSVRENKYIIRIPGEGTGELINRKNEAQVYQAIKGKGLCDDLVYIDAASGIKITSLVEGTRVCDPYSVDDLAKCMEKLRSFHAMKLKVDHTFDIFGQIEFYESLMGGVSQFSDYAQVKAKVFKLCQYISSLHIDHYLTHIDAVPDNFLFTTRGIQLIDWEYAGMQDQCVDLAMFSIYSMYEKKELTDRLVDIYFQGHSKEQDRIKIYCYVALCGLLWSNWCEYKKTFGVDFGEYALRQYEYAREYSALALSLI